MPGRLALALPTTRRPSRRKHGGQVRPLHRGCSGNNPKARLAGLHEPYGKGHIMNRVQFTGRLVADLERAETKGGTTVAKGRLAIDRAGQNNETGYIAFESYGPRADAALKTIGKGWLIALDGRLQHDQWEQDGQKRQAYKFVGDIEYLAAPQNRGESRDMAQETEADIATEAEAEADPDLEPAEAIPASAQAAAESDAELAMA